MRTGHVAQNVAGNTARLLFLCGALIGCGSAELPADNAAPPTIPNTVATTGGAKAAAPVTPASTGQPSSVGSSGSTGTMQTTNQPPVVAPGTGATGATPPAATTGVTYHKDIRPLIEANCVECHSGDPKFLIAPMALNNFQAVMPYAPLVVTKVMAGEMPPWPAASDCRKIADDRSLPMDVREKFAMWQANSFAEGNEADYVAPMERRSSSLGEPDLILQMSLDYMPRTNDEYTWFGLADDTGKIYTFPSTKNMVAVQVLPGTPSEVHHVQLHRTGGAPGAGPSGSAASVENMFSWRPGSTPLVYPPDSAAVITQGNGFALQMHYNSSSATGPGGYKPDRTRVAFWFMKEGTPKNIITRVGVFGAVNIPAGAKEVISNAAYSVAANASVVGVTPHAHMLATRMSSTIASGGGAPSCLVNVPKWDFHWQLDYMLAEPIKGPAQIAATCVWDNSPEHQPSINNMKLQPRNVTFGEESLAEMCLHYIWISTPAR